MSTMDPRICKQAGLVAHKSEKGGEKDLMVRSVLYLSSFWVLLTSPRLETQ